VFLQSAGLRRVAVFVVFHEESVDLLLQLSFRNVEHPDACCESLVEIALVQIVACDAAGEGGVDEDVVADENTHMVDAVLRVPEKHEVARLEFAALDPGSDRRHLSRRTGKLHIEGFAEHEPDKSGAIESGRGLAAETVTDAKVLLYIGEKVLDVLGRVPDRSEQIGRWIGTCDFS